MQILELGNVRSEKIATGWGIPTTWGISPTLDPELLQPVSEGIAGYAEALSGLRLVTARLTHCSLYHRPFPLTQVDSFWELAWRR